MTQSDTLGLPQAEIERRQAAHLAALELRSGSPVPFLVEPFAMWYVRSDLLENHAADLAEQLEKNRVQATVGDYYLPHLKPGTGLGTIATAFGCEWRADPDADPWVIPAIRDDAGAVYHLAEPTAPEAGCGRIFLDKLAYFEKRSALPVCACNLASPLTAASQVWEYSSFLAAMIEHPREVHRLLEIVTEYMIRFLRANMAAIGNLWGLTHMNWYLPPGQGVRVSDDVLAVISPRQYREFGVRYNNILSREFGGIVIHSCGNIVHNIPTILETEGLRAIDLTLPHNDVGRVAELAAGKTALMLRYWVQDWEDQRAPDLLEYTVDALRRLGNCGIMLEMQAPSKTSEEATQLAQALREREWIS